MDGEELQRALLRAARLFDPLSAALLDDAAGAHATRIPGAGIAKVTFDSRVAPSQVRGGARVRLLTFEAAGVSVDVEVTPGRAGA